MKDLDLEDFGKYLRSKIDALKIKDGTRFYEVAEKVGVTKQHLINICKGDTAIRVNNLVKLSKVLDFNLFTYFITDIPEVDTQKSEGTTAVLSQPKQDTFSIEEKLEFLQKEIAYLKRINTLQAELLEKGKK